MWRRGALGAGRIGRWLLAAAVGCATLAPATAQAGTYDVWSCRAPDDAPLGSAAWERSTVDPSTGALVAPNGVGFGDECGLGGPLSVALLQDAAIGSPVAGLLTFRAPPDTRIAGYALSRRLTAGAPPALFATYLAARREWAAGASVGDDDFCDAAGCLRGDLDPDAPASIVERPLATGDAIELRVEVECLLMLCLNALSSTPPRADLHWSRVTLEDALAPDPPQVGGRLAQGATGAGPATLVVAAHDRGGGIESMSLAIDGRPWQTVRSGASVASCRAPYSLPAPCPADVEHAFEVDTGALPPGDHQASGTVVDAAGNSTPWGPVPFRVEPPPTTVVTTPPKPAPGPSNGRPAVERPRLRLDRTVLEAGAGRPVRLRGRLTTREGVPIAGARLTVAIRQLGLRGGVPNRRRRAVVTDTAGRFAIAQRARGARKVTVSFSPRPGSAVTAQAAATVRGRLGLRTAPAAGRLVKGRLLTLRGRLAGAGPSARGALVQIEAIVNGRWRPVGRTRANRRGDYAWRYRFVHLTRDTVFRFRAVVEHVPGWPWPTVRGEPVAVRVDVP